MLVIKINFATGDLPIHWNRYPREIEFISFVSKKCHNKNRFRTAAAAPALASVANMTLYRNECSVEFGLCAVCQEYVIFWLELMSLSVCVFFSSFQCSIFLFLRIFVSFPTFSPSAIGILLLFCVDLISISNTISPAMPLTIIIFFGVFFLYHPTNAKSRNIWIKCANFCTCPFRNWEMIDSSVR